jgi:2-polyprenyl-6-hydroxyphenyl methylase/3-demethylubiquinone-9 3-methyltransferase
MYSSSQPDDRSLEAHFEFGRNWERLVPEVDESRVQAAMRDISSFFQRDLAGLSFLDVGCGSGLSSYAAYRLGARSITSVDIDPKNVANVRRIKQRFEVDPSYPWACEVRSIVDPDDVMRLPHSDVVYAWGVLHHTGAMWDAISNSASLVNPGGFLYLMLYRDAWSAPLWRAIKRRYVRSGAGVKFVLRNTFAAALIAGLIIKGRNPRRVMRDYGRNSRGMSWYVDVTDWVGGYPFEYTAAEAVIARLAQHGFALRNIVPPLSARPIGLRGTGSYQYLFQRG